MTRKWLIRPVLYSKSSENVKNRPKFNLLFTVKTFGKISLLHRRKKIYSCIFPTQHYHIGSEDFRIIYCTRTMWTTLMIMLWCLEALVPIHYIITAWKTAFTQSRVSHFSQQRALQTNLCHQAMGPEAGVMERGVAMLVCRIGICFTLDQLDNTNHNII